MRQKSRAKENKKAGRIRSYRGYLLAAAVLMAGILICMKLPVRLLAWQDEKRMGKSRIESAKEVELTAQMDMSILKKIQMLQDDNNNFLNMANGKHYTVDSAAQKVKEEFLTLRDLGILQDTGLEHLELDDLEISFVMSREDSEQSLMMWSGYGYTEHSAFVWVMDDETGKLLSFCQWNIYAKDKKTAEKAEGDFGEETVDGVLGEEAEPSDDEESELYGLAEKWADYLGCQVTQILVDIEAIEAYDQAVTDVTSVSEDGTGMANELAYLVKSMINEGLSEYEAYEAALEMLGYGINLGEGVCVFLEDEEGTASYWLQKSTDDGSFQIQFDFF